MTDAVQRGRPEHFVGRKGITPLLEVQVAGDQGGGPLVAFGDQVVEDFILWRAQGLQPEIVDDEQRRFDQGLQAPGVIADGLCLAQAGNQLALRVEQHVVADPGGAPLSAGLGC